MKKLFAILGLGISVYVALCAWLYFGQRSILYHAKQESSSTVAETMWLETSGAKLKIWALPGTGEDAIIYFGGNAEPIELNLENYRDWFAEQNVYLLNYRGSGGSTGNPTEIDLCADAVVVYDYLHRTHDRISVIGRSLGSGVASCLASERRVEKLALVTPFDSILAVAQNIYSIFPVELILKDTFDSAARAPNIDAEVLVILATEDKMVPMHHGHALADAFAPEQVTVREISGAGHINISDFAEYGQLLRKFL